MVQMHYQSNVDFWFEFHIFKSAHFARRHQHRLIYFWRLVFLNWDLSLSSINCPIAMPMLYVHVHMIGKIPVETDICKYVIETWMQFHDRKTAPSKWLINNDTRQKVTIGYGIWLYASMQLCAQCTHTQSERG